MTAAAILQAILTYGPQVVPLIQKLVQWAESGKTSVTAADIQELIDYGNKSSADYLKAVGGAPLLKAA